MFVGPERMGLYITLLGNLPIANCQFLTAGAELAYTPMMYSDRFVADPLYRAAELQTLAADAPLVRLLIIESDFVIVCSTCWTFSFVCCMYCCHGMSPKGIAMACLRKASGCRALHSGPTGFGAIHGSSFYFVFMPISEACGFAGTSILTFGITTLCLSQVLYSS